MEHTEHCKKRMKWGDGECECKHRVSASFSNELLCGDERFVYKYREIGESGWRFCTKADYLFFDKSPEHDTNKAAYKDT